MTKCILAAVLPGRHEDRGQCATSHGSHTGTPSGALAATPEHALVGNGGSLRTCGGSPRPLAVTQSPVHPVRSPMRHGPAVYAENTMGMGTAFAQRVPATYTQAVMRAGTKFAQRVEQRHCNRRKPYFHRPSCAGSSTGRGLCPVNEGSNNVRLPHGDACVWPLKRVCTTKTSAPGPGSSHAWRKRAFVLGE